MRRITTASLWLCAALAPAHAAHCYENGTAKMPMALSTVIADERANRVTEAALGRACSNWGARRDDPTPLMTLGFWGGPRLFDVGLTPRQRFLGKCIKGKPVYAREVVVGYIALPTLATDLQRCLPGRDVQSSLARASKKGTFITLDIDDVAVTGAEFECLRDSSSVRYIEPNCNPMYSYRRKRGFAAIDDMQPHCKKLWAKTGATALTGLQQIGLTGGMHLQSASVRVAVLDSGVDCAHEGLLKSMAHPNSGGCAVVKDSDMIDCDDVADGCAADDLDCDSHGTEIAGTIAAQPSVSEQMIGVAPHAEILPIRVTRQNPTRLASLALALYTAAGQGSRVINLSWDNVFDSRALYEAIANVGPESLVIAASSGDEAPFPAIWSTDLPNLIAVAATTFDAGRPPTRILALSKYRDGHLAAPGQCVYSTTSYRQGGDRYWYNDGASSAAAIVSGAAAVVLGDSRFANCSAAEIKRLLVQCEASILKRVDAQGEFAFLNVAFLDNGLNSPQVCRDGKGLPQCVGAAFR